MEQQVYGAGFDAGEEPRNLMQSILRGCVSKCPKCGVGSLFRAFLKVDERCPNCHEELHHHRADDLPAYLVIVIMGHVVVAAFMFMEANFDLSMWTHLAMWVPVTIIGSLLLLTPVKGAVVGLQWALKMHGFGGKEDVPADDIGPER